jgi:hypothetical protein
MKYSCPSAFCAETAEQMIALLQKHAGPDVFAFLDHDLGGKQWVDSAEKNTGMEVVRWIVANKPPLKHVVVHSHNNIAAKEMRLKLADAGYSVEEVPFYRLDFDAFAALSES